MGRIGYVVPENWIAKYLEPKHPELVEPYREAAQITEAALRTGTLSDAELDLLVERSGHPARMLADAAIEMLGRLARVFPAAMLAVQELARASRAATREHAVLALLHSTPSAEHTSILTAALRDTSKLVRETAAHCIRRLRLANLTTELDDAQARERDTALAQHLAKVLADLRRG